MRNGHEDLSEISLMISPVIIPVIIAMIFNMPSFYYTLIKLINSIVLVGVFLMDYTSYKDSNSIIIKIFLYLRTGVYLYLFIIFFPLFKIYFYDKSIWNIHDGIFIGMVVLFIYLAHKH